MIGGYLPLLHAGHRVGHGDTIVLESCEYCDSFLNFFPTLAVVLNVEADHLDYFKDLADIQKSFHKFARHGYGCRRGQWRRPPYGPGPGGHSLCVLRPWREATGSARRTSATTGGTSMCSCDGKFYCHVDLGVLGRHNTMNALAAAATSWIMGIPGQTVTRWCEKPSTGQAAAWNTRAEYRGAEVYDDYAHHPDELRATLEAVRAMGRPPDGPGLPAPYLYPHQGC